MLCLMFRKRHAPTVAIFTLSLNPTGSCAVTDTNLSCQWYRVNLNLKTTYVVKSQHTPVVSTVFCFLCLREPLIGLIVELRLN